jgi:acetolactate synthase-1/2/3 large subunit
MHHELPVVAVVSDDSAFGNARRIQAQAYSNRLIASDLTNPDFVRSAESFGITFRATIPDARQDALQKAFALNAPALVHVPVGEVPSPWDMILLPRLRGPRGRPAAAITQTRNATCAVTPAFSSSSLPL